MTLESQFINYSNQVFDEALKLLPKSEQSRENIIFEPVFSDEIIAKIQFSNPRKIIYSYGFSMLVYRIVRLALATNPIFYAKSHEHTPIPKEEAVILLGEIARNVKANKQGGLDYPVSPQVVQMAERITKDADIFFILHELCHCLIIDDEFNPLFHSLIWGTAAKIPKLGDKRIEHEILADRLASIFKFEQLFIERNDDYYEKLKVLWQKNLEDHEIETLKKQDMGLKLIGIECALLSQLIQEKSGNKDPGYLNFSDRVNWNRKFLVDAFGFSKDVFFIPEAIVGYMIELLKEIDFK
jgi:hypothetical protein